MTAAAPRVGPRYIVTPGDIERDREAVLAVWRGNIGKEDRLAAKFDWFYRRNSEGPPLFVLLRDTRAGEWVGIATLGPRRLILDEREIMAGLLADFVVAPHHRSLGPALMLQKELVELGAARFDFIYGFPNPKALPVFRRAGFAIMGHLERHARIILHSEYLSRSLPRAISIPLGKGLDFPLRSQLALDGARGLLRSSFQVRADPRMSALWASSKSARALTKIRDIAYLHWRFDEMPSSPIRHLLVENAESGVLEASFACIAQGGRLHLLDFIAKKGVSSAHVRALLRAASKEGYASVSVEFAEGNEASGFRECGFVFRDTRPIVGRWTRPLSHPSPRLHFTAADEDE